MITALREPISVGGVTVPNRVFLAPLAGVSDIPFRRICQEMGAGLTSVEMLSATAITHKARRTMEMARRHADEPLLALQITGPTPEAIAEGIRRLAPVAYDLIDINMGCPVKKIVSRGCGSALLRDPQAVSQIVEQARESTSRPLTVKIRLGFDRDEMNVEDNAARIARAGASLLTIHGRTRSENYQVAVDYGAIAAGVRAARAAAPEQPPVLVGNGDVFGRDGAQRMLERTHCDAVMVSRGALGNPWIFDDILGRRERQPTIEEWRDVVLRHLHYHAEFYPPEKTAAVLFRKHLLWYLHGFPGVKKMRDRCSTIPSVQAARDALDDYVASLPDGLRRYADKNFAGSGRPRVPRTPNTKWIGNLTAVPPIMSETLPAPLRGHVGHLPSDQGRSISSRMALARIPISAGFTR